MPKVAEEVEFEELSIVVLFLVSLRNNKVVEDFKLVF